ncbi:MAG: hypothetical protein H6Q36_1244 [Chloroflexi bacterium]|nr:hypothetical protein [Chloroflexota bacterium]
MSGESAGEPTPSPSPGPAESTLDQAGPSPVDQLLEAGREALAGDEPGRAAVALGLALRSDPASAPAVVAAVEEVGTLSGIAEAGSGESAPGGEPGPVQDPGFAALAVVQGDALRAAGRDDEAELAYDFARKLAASGGTPATTPSPDETGQPAADGGVDRPPPGGSS